MRPSSHLQRARTHTTARARIRSYAHITTAESAAAADIVPAQEAYMQEFVQVAQRDRQHHWGQGITSLAAASCVGQEALMIIAPESGDLMFFLESPWMEESVWLKRIVFVCVLLSLHHNFSTIVRMRLSPFLWARPNKLTKCLFPSPRRACNGKWTKSRDCSSRAGMARRNTSSGMACWCLYNYS